MSQSDWRNKLGVGLAGLGVAAWLALLAVTFVPALEYKPEQYAAEDHRKQAREDADTSAQVWMAWAAWVQVGVGAIGLLGLGATVVFAGLAWRETKRGADQAKRSADEARRQADAAEKQLDESRMPHLFLEVPDWTVQADDIIKAKLRISNWSDNAAVILTGRYNVVMANAFTAPWVVVDESPPPAAASQMLLMNFRVLARGGEPFEHECCRLLDPGLMTEEEFAGLSLGDGASNVSPFLFGWFRFSDGRGQEYERRFAFRYQQRRPDDGNPGRWFEIKTYMVPDRVKKD